MNCKSKVSPELAKAIQTMEDHLKAHKESIMHELENAFIKALLSGMPLEEMEILERTRWTKRKREAIYTVIIKRQKIK